MICLALAAANPLGNEDNDPYLNQDDCAPCDIMIHPGMTEVCDGVDQNCNLQVDEGVGVWMHPDVDGDGYGTAAFDSYVCAGTPGYVESNDDCDDDNPDNYPFGGERECDGFDDNCNGLVDEGLVGYFYGDQDGDGAGNYEDLMLVCGEWPEGYVENDVRDCDDTNPDIYIGNPEVCDGLDNDCDGNIDATDNWHVCE